MMNILIWIIVNNYSTFLFISRRDNYLVIIFSTAVICNGRENISKQHLQKHIIKNETKTIVIKYCVYF